MLADQAFGTLDRRLRQVGIQATTEQLGQFRVHFDLLVKWNRSINLTAIRDPAEVIERHFVESAFLGKLLEPFQGVLLDIGSGGGFPGVPIKVLFPALRVILVEPVQKKAAFLKEVARALGGAVPLEVRPSRASEVRERGDWITMRAVRPDARLLEQLIALLVPRGTLAILMGAKDVQFLGPGWEVHDVPDSRGRVAAFHVKPPSASVL